MREISAGEARDILSAGGATLIDVREEREHAANRVADSVLIPMSEFVDRVDEVPGEGAVILICRSGSRSARVGEWLESNADVDEVINLEGGIIAWAAQGLPYEGDAPG